MKSSLYIDCCTVDCISACYSAYSPHFLWVMYIQRYFLVLRRIRILPRFSKELVSIWHPSSSKLLSIGGPFASWTSACNTMMHSHGPDILCCLWTLIRIWRYPECAVFWFWRTTPYQHSQLLFFSPMQVNEVLPFLVFSSRRPKGDIHFHMLIYYKGALA